MDFYFKDDITLISGFENQFSFSQIEILTWQFHISQRIQKYFSSYLKGKIKMNISIYSIIIALRKKILL